MSKKTEIILLLVVIALGIFFRLYKINTIPPGLHGDEAQSGLEAIKILKGAPYSPYTPEVYGQTTLYFYWLALIFKIFGISPTPIRLSSAIIGIITLPILYFLLKKITNKQIALIAIFLLSVSRWHVHLSRLGFMTIFMTLFQTLTFLPLLLALKYKKPIYFIVSGFFLGIGLHTYMAFRLVPFIILPVIIYYFLFTRQNLKNKLINLLALFLAAFIFFFPLLQYALKNYGTFMYRIRSIWMFGQAADFKSWQALKQNAIDTLLMFNVRGSLWPHKNLPGAPMLDRLTGIFFLIGLLLVIKRIKQPLQFLLVNNLIIMSLVSVLSITFYPKSGGDPIRSSGALFSAIIISAIGFEFISRLFKKFRYIFIGLTATAIILLNSKAYFITFARHLGVWHDFFALPVSIAYETQKYSPKNYGFYLLSNWIYGDYLSIKFLSSNRQIQNQFLKIDQYSPLPPNLSSTKGSVYFVLPYYENYLQTLQNTFPYGKILRKNVGPEEYYFIFINPPPI